MDVPAALERAEERRVLEERPVLDRFVHAHQVLVAPPEVVEDGRVRELDRISRAGRRAAPAVEDDERYEGIAARQTASKDSTSSDAPPTRAPSTAPWPMSSAALSGFTDPPYSTGTSRRPLTNACASWASSGVAVRPVPI